MPRALCPGFIFSVLLAHVAFPPAAAQENARGAWRATNFRTMLMWKAHEHIDFNFTNVQLDKALASDDSVYIKRRCREQINQPGCWRSVWCHGRRTA